MEIIMKTWLFTWNPDRWAWDDDITGYKEMKNDIDEVGFAYGKWSCGVNKSIVEGDRIFLIRLGRKERGIVASGYAASSVLEGIHWDIEKREEGKTARRIYIKFDCIIDNMEKILKYDDLKSISDKMAWSAQSSGISIPDDVAEKLELEWKNYC